LPCFGVGSRKLCPKTRIRVAVCASGSQPLLL